MNRLRTPTGLVKAAFILALLISVGWLALTSAMIQSVSGSAGPKRRGTFADSPEVVLANATRALVTQRGILSPATLAAVRRAAAVLPLDARPYLILGHQAILDRQDARALRMLEAGQRLDPRQRIIHVLLLDRYLRSGQLDKAGDQFGVLARLVDAAQAQIATLLASMIVQPETRAAALRTLRADPALEQVVLVALARTNVDPATLFAIASPAAKATATRPGAWGTTLLQRLADAKRLPEAKPLWQRLYSVPADKAAALLYDPAFQGWPGGPPFNWSIGSSSFGGVDRHDGGMTIEYYGRDTGELAGQALVLPPGRYRFSLAASDSATATAKPALSWTVRCVGGEDQALSTLLLDRLGTAARRYRMDFTVPSSGCAGQRLALTGMAGEFPSTTRATIDHLSLQQMGR